jgi:hypothetical protein
MEPLSSPKPAVEEDSMNEPLPTVAAAPPSARAEKEPALIANFKETREDKEIDSDESQEVDVWWGSYAGRTMAPSFMVCALLTGIIIWGVWQLWPANEDRPYLMRYTDYILVGAVWLFQLTRWAYRIIGINYRLTTKRLFCQRGFQTSASRSLNLAQIATVRVERLRWIHFLKVGRLRIVPVDDSQPPMILESVLNPNHVAAAIMKQAKQARERTNVG